MAGGSQGVWTGDPEAMVLDRPQHHPARSVRPDTAHHALVRLGRPGRLTSTSAAVPRTLGATRTRNNQALELVPLPVGLRGHDAVSTSDENRPAPQGVRAAAAVATVTC